jgi:hypothetical protein
MSRSLLAAVSGASGYMQHAAPAQGAAIWRDFVQQGR